MTHPRPTTELWDLLQDATAEAAKRGHKHVGTEHLLFVLAATPHVFARSILVRRDVAESVAADLDEMMSSEAYAKAGSNEVIGTDGELIGHLVIGSDGEPTLVRSSPR